MDYRIFHKFILLIALCFLSAITYAAQSTSPHQLGDRTITFVNKCSFPVWFGMSGGAAPSKLPGNTVKCNTNDDCYAGSSCTQTGATKQCFWNNPQPTNGSFKLEADGGSNTVLIPRNVHPTNMFWTGSMAGRTNCTGTSCETGDCGTGDKACKSGMGMQPPISQAEFSFSTTNVDFYDISIINGHNIPISITPDTRAKFNPTDPYYCGSPGAINPSSSLLGGCNWNLTPPSNDYIWVRAGGKSCTTASDCDAPSVCGLSFHPGQAQLLKKTCGAQLGFWTAFQVCGMQPDYGAPFNCATRLPAPQDTLTLWNLYACVGIDSCYQDNAASNCCGCVNWNEAGLPVPGAPYTKQCTNKNQNWLTHSQPKIQWLKEACPTAYVYPYDDMSSTFVCKVEKEKVNTTNYTITYCPGTVTPSTAYDYTVFVGNPFSTVKINGSISCPDPITGNPACLVSKQGVGTNMVIKGSNPQNICTLKIQANGSVVIDTTQSSGCNINSVPASTGKAGEVMLPSGF